MCENSWRLLNLFLIYVIVICARKTSAELVSPCPGLFSYEVQKHADKWYGTVTLISDSDLMGVWLRLVFDKPSLQLGNWFGQIKTMDNKVYLIKNRNHRLEAHMPYALKFFLKYNPNEPPPQLVMFRLNGKIVCPDQESTTPAAITGGGQLFARDVGSSSPPSADRFGDNDALPEEPHAIDKQSLKEILDIDNCGIVPQPITFDKDTTHEGQFPWHGVLYRERKANTNLVCAVTLISKIHVITVSHCIIKRGYGVPVHPTKLVVYLGKHYLNESSNPGIQQLQVARIISHPKYKAVRFANDIAILKLRNSVVYSDYIRPVCLWNKKDADISTVVGKAGNVVGWGFDGTGELTEELMQAKMPVVDRETCIYSYPEFFSRFTTNNTYCAGYRNGTSVCNGDVGGGMVFPQATSVPHRTAWHLRGLVTVSVASLEDDAQCDTTHYTVFTDVAQYLDWIQEAMAK